MFTSTDELIGEVTAWAAVEFVILRAMGQVKSKVKTLSFRRAIFQLFKELVDGTPWETAVRGVKEQNTAGRALKDVFLRAQELYFCV